MHDPLCTHCGFNNPVGMRFCGNCGTPLSEMLPAASGLPTTDRLQALMGRDVQERLRRAGVDAAGQRRNVTVLFADLSNYTAMTQKLDDEAVYRLIKRYLHILAEDVYRYEGTVDKFTGDGIMALFGAPVAHENNAERAIRAALDMQAGITMLRQAIQTEYGIDLQMRIGLNSGSVIVGEMGVDQMMDYTAIGDTVNLASRLETAADPGTIVVSDSVYRQSQALFNFKDLPDLELKGYDQPFNAYQVLGPKRAPGAVRGIEGLSAPLVGREAELSLLRNVVAGLQGRRQGHVVFVSGEAGIGKSRLTAEFKTYLQNGHFQILEGKSLTYRKSISYWIFTDLLRNYLGVSEDTPENEVRENLRKQVHVTVGKQADQLLPYLERLLSLDTSQPETLNKIEFLDAGQLRRQIFLAVKELLTAEARRHPLVLILEDLHWADETSIDLIHFLLESIHEVPLLIYCISRPFQGGPLVKIMDRAREGDRFTSIDLRSLSRQESNQLLEQLLEVPELPEPIRSQILQKAAGVPFFLEEILRMLIEENFIQKENNHWQLVPGSTLSKFGVPDTLQDLILTRFDRLDLISRRVLQVAAIIGREFTLQVLQLVLEGQLNEWQIEGALEVLMEREFLALQSNGAQAIYAFKHVLTSDAVYSTMLKQDRSVQHLLVAQAIEKLFSDRLDGYVELLASHYLRSPQLDRAVQYLVQAGQKAAADYANEQARQHFVTALGLLPRVVSNPEQVYQIHVGLGDVLTLVGEYQAARTHYQSAMDIVENTNSQQHIRERSDLHRKMGITFERQGDFEKALTRLSIAMHTLREEPDSPIEEARIVNDMGWIYFRRGETDEAEMYLNLALSKVNESSHYNLIASIYNRLGGVYYQKDQYDQAREFVRKSIKLRESIGDIVELARSYNNLGLLDWKRGQWENALQSFSRSMELNATLEDVEAMIHLQGNIGLLHVDRGELHEAKKHLEESLERARAIGHGFLEGAANLHLSRYWLAVKDWPRALSHGQEGLKILMEIGAHENLADTYWCIGEAWLGLGDIEKAHEAEAAATKLLEERGTKSLVPTLERGQIFRLRGKIASQTHDYGIAKRYFTESVQQFEALDNKLELGRSWFEMARLAKETEDASEGMILLDKAVKIFKQLGAQIDLSETQNLVF